MGEHLGRDISCDDIGSGSESVTDRKRHGATSGTKIQDALPRTDAGPLDEPLTDGAEERHDLVVCGSQPIEPHCVGSLHALSFSRLVATDQGGTTFPASSLRLAHPFPVSGQDPVVQTAQQPPGSCGRS